MLARADLRALRLVILELDRLEAYDAVVAALAARGFVLVEEIWNTTCCINTVKHLVFARDAQSGKKNGD